MYQQDIFYRVSDFEQKLALITRAKELCYEWYVNKLDCSISWSRQRIEMSYEEIMGKFDPSCHFVCILRRGYNDPFYGEIGFTTMTGVSYYLWIHLTRDTFEHLLDEFNMNVEI